VDARELRILVVAGPGVREHLHGLELLSDSAF